MTETLPPAELIEENEHPWHSDRQPAGCPHCQRIFLVPDNRIGSTCPLCRRGNLTTQPILSRPGVPEKLLPFKINRQQLIGIYEKFVLGMWIKPEDFKTELLLNRTIPVFWPLWLVDSDVSGRWQMEAGFDYQVESAKETYVSGQWQSQKEVETRIRWEPRLGQVNTHIENVSVPALDGHKKRQALTGNYALSQASDFEPQLLGSAVLEMPDLPPEQAWPQAKPLVDQAIGNICVDASQAQHQRNFTLEAIYEHLHWTEFFLPMYTTFYTDDNGDPQILFVNGESGRISGLRLASQKKGFQIAGIMAVIAGVFLLLALLGFLLTMILPLASIVAALAGLLGIALGIAAIVPAVWPSQWNRKQR